MGEWTRAGTVLPKPGDRLRLVYDDAEGRRVEHDGYIAVERGDPRYKRLLHHAVMPARTITANAGLDPSDPKYRHHAIDADTIVHAIHAESKRELRISLLSCEVWVESEPVTGAEAMPEELVVLEDQEGGGAA
jgi:hypothetical protein